MTTKSRHMWIGWALGVVMIALWLAPLAWGAGAEPGRLGSDGVGIGNPIVTAQNSGHGQPEALYPAQGGRPAQPAAPGEPEDVLWSQPVSSSDWDMFIDQEFPDSPSYSSYLADDFVNDVPWTLTSIFVPGGLWNEPTSLLYATALHWLIYADNGGVPAGDPSGGGAAAVWSLNLLPTDPQVTLSTGLGGYLSDTRLTVATPVSLPPGHWWLVFYPTMSFDPYGQYGRRVADTTNGYVGQYINPGGGFGHGTAWQAWTLLGPPSPLYDTAFTLEGVSAFRVNSTGDEADANLGNGLCATAGGLCTLRAAIQEANYGGGREIVFTGLPASSTIQVGVAGLGALPALTAPITIDGTTAGGGFLELDGTLLASGYGLTIDANGCVLKGLAINRFGVGIEIESSNNLIEGNRIGTDVTGMTAPGNDNPGVVLYSSGQPVQNNVIRGNVISGNGSYGLYVYGSLASGNVIEGNHIGTNAYGTASLGNLGPGVGIWDAPNNQIGGPTATQRNFIAGNSQSGVQIEGSLATGNVVQGNYIGTNALGDKPLGNGAAGIELSDAPGNLIGGPAAKQLSRWCTGACNLVSANGGVGILLTGTGTTGNIIQGNSVGTDKFGRLDLGNGSDGIRIDSAGDNTIGGPEVGDGNRIAFNAAHGVSVRASTSTGNALLSNAIHANDSLGIDLGDDDVVTPNDPGDGDTGPNQNQNFPVLTWATTGSTVVSGTLNSLASTEFRIEFFYNEECDPAGYGEGQEFLGSAQVTTDLAGDAAISVTFPVTIPAGSYVAATATDPNGNTSELSECRIAIPENMIVISPTIGGQLTYTDTQTLTTTVEVPEGAVTETIILALLQLDESSHGPLPGMRLGREPFDLAAYLGNTELEGYEFLKPLTVTIHYSEADIFGIDETGLGLYYWDGTTWQDAATTCSPPSTYVHDMVLNVLQVPICHLTEWNIQGPDLLEWRRFLPPIMKGATSK